MNKKSIPWFIAAAVIDLVGAALIYHGVNGEQTWVYLGAFVLMLGSLAIFQGILVGRHAAVARGPSATRRASKWRPEPELTRIPPRQVEMRPQMRVVAGLWLIMAAVLGYFTILSFQQPQRLGLESQMLEREGIHAAGVVHDKQSRPNSAGDTSYYLYYNFQDEYGQEVRSSRRVDKSVWDRFQEGSSLEIVHLPGNPLSHMVPSLEGGGAIGRPVLPPRAMLLVLVGVGAVLMFMDMQRRRQKRLVQYGTAVAARVEAVSIRGANKLMKVEYEVGGRAFTLKATERNPRVEEGDELTVLYLPDAPDRGVLYRIAVYRATASRL